MKITSILSVALVAAAAGAQTTSQSQIRHIETSLNHLTVLEFGEPVTTLAIADPDSFQIERHGDKVFVKPLREGVSTNLFVWTASRELSYELDPAGQLAQMDVLVRTDPARNPDTSTQAAIEPSDIEIRRIASLVLGQAMMGVEDIVHDQKKRTPGRVQIDLEQIYRANDRIYIRYSVANETKAPFRVTTPDVDSPDPTRYPISLVGLRNHQITSRTFASFKAKEGSEMTLIEGESGSHDLGPGEKATGVISIGNPVGTLPRIYQLHFGADQHGPLKVEAVL
jgi:Conjugal transfer protein/TraK protein